VLKEAKSGNKDPALFFINLGDFSKKVKVEDQETSPYVTHDLEHAIFVSNVYDSENADRDLEMFSKEDERSNAWNFDKYHPVNKPDFYDKTRQISSRFKGDIKLLDKIANKKDMFISLPDHESNAIKIELAFKDFFNEINYAKAIGVGDIMPSAWAYCVSNMKDKHDLDEVNNANISEESKKIICYILENSHDNCMDILNKFLLSGETIKCSIFVAPDDSPEIVILLGSPPSKDILFLIHLRDWIISNKAKLDLSSSGLE
jgi:hypothetical protein